MKNLINLISQTGCFTLGALGLLGGGFSLCAQAQSAKPQKAMIDYEEPKLLIGNIFAPEARPNKLLFKSRRMATRTGTTVKVLCEYTYPDGSLAARDLITYEAGHLVSVETDEFQIGETGKAVIGPDPKSAGQRRIVFEYTKGHGGEEKRSSDSESLQNDTLVDDMIPDFMVSHWDGLMAGETAKFRFIALSRKETVGFKLVKESETTRAGKAVVRIKMEPTSIIIARLVDPLYFIVEKDGAHRVLEYIGRTTPLIKNGAKWKDLDGDTVFDWPAAGGALSAQR